MNLLIIRYSGKNCEKLKKKYENEFDFIECQKIGRSSNFLLKKEAEEIVKIIKDKNAKEVSILNLSKKELKKLQDLIPDTTFDVIENKKNISNKILMILLLIKHLFRKGYLDATDYEWLKDLYKERENKERKNKKDKKSDNKNEKFTKATFFNYLKDIESILNNENFSKTELVEKIHVKKNEIKLILKNRANILNEFFDEIDDVEKLTEYFMYFDDKLMKGLDTATKEKINTLQRKILYRQKPFEELNNIRDVFYDFVYAIEKNLFISFIEKAEGEIHKNVIPLKLVFMENNWYLAGVYKEKIKFYRLNFIYDYKISNKRFSKNVLLQKYFEFLEKFETPFTKFGEKWKKLVLKVDKSKKHYFENKVHFPKEKNKKTDKDGNLIIECAYTQPLEVLPIIKKWLPFVEVVESEDGSVEKELKKDLLLALNKLS